MVVHAVDEGDVREPASVADEVHFIERLVRFQGRQGKKATECWIGKYVSYR